MTTSRHATVHFGFPLRRLCITGVDLPRLLLRRPIRMVGVLAASVTTAAFAASPASPKTTGDCARVLKAEVVALEQAIVLNRLGAFNPAGMLYALRHDVVFEDGSPLSDDKWHRAPGHVQLRGDKRPRPLVLRANEGDCLEVTLHNLLAPAVEEDRSGGPRITGGKVPAHQEDPPGVVYPAGGRSGRELVTPSAISNDVAHTRGVTFHVTGLEVQAIRPEHCPRATIERQWLCGLGQGNVGLNTSVVHPSTPAALAETLRRQGGTVHPGQSAVYRFKAFREGTFFAYSNAATVGGEGDGGQLGLGLFGAVNVEPRGSVWYRSQVTHRELRAATITAGPRHPFSRIRYDTARHATGPLKGLPILAMLDGDRIVHSDLNAIVALRGAAPDRNDTTSPTRPCTSYADGNACGRSFREFTVILHDEVKAVQAFAELEDEDNPLAYLKDGMGINYGTGGMGAMVIARNRRVGPARDCPECRAEEFFLSSWVNGDPALLLKWDATGQAPSGAMYPDDPSNVHHSYLNDPVRFRNLHAGPKETHIFHLHAHQWVMDASDRGSSYLDSQTISPGAGFSYEISHGGAGNRNLSPGDSIFHCHLYPHFAQGMWELWRVHDVFEDGTPGLFDPGTNPGGRNLPDAEVAQGIENPAVVPLPGAALPPMPSAQFRGYPFYIEAEAGHRPPQPPLDMDRTSDAALPAGAIEDASIVDGGLPRHHLSNTRAGANRTKPAVTETRLVNQDVVDEALAKGGLTARINAAKVYAQNPQALTALAEVWESIGSVSLLPHGGSARERGAMAFHSGEAVIPGAPGVKLPATPAGAHSNVGYRTEFAATVAGQDPPAGQPVFHVNGKPPKPGAPFADPCPADPVTRRYRGAYVQTELTVNKHGWFDPQARLVALEQDVKDIIDPNTRVKMPEPLFFRANSGECIEFRATNLMPNALALDDFQVYTPTDTIGQHIHLVKFDVTSSDGSGNGWNYEDGTFSPEEVQERVFAINRARAAAGDPSRLTLKTHPMFAAACNGDRLCEALKARGECPPDAHTMDRHELAKNHPFCGAQRTVQRWWADPLINANGKDHTLRTVFTHDHFGPSSHQQHGLYSALVVEPANSVWLPLDSAALDWDRLCRASPADRATMVIGGANLSDRHDAMCREGPVPRGVGRDELRPPIPVRDDGGPTSLAANIVAPKCIGRNDTNPLDPAWRPGPGNDCAGPQLNDQTRREYLMAFADFGILYNTALEPINPEKRDESALRLGRRFVARNLAQPLGISSEDPGTQFVNYRHEPVPLRITDIRTDTIEPELGGFRYSQTPCDPAEPDEKKRLTCTGDPANVMSTLAHADRDRRLATQDYTAFVHAVPDPLALVSRQTRESIVASRAADAQGAPLSTRLGDALREIESWRRDFHCAILPESELSSGCRAGLARGEPWRRMGDPSTPIPAAYEGDKLQIRLIQGAQEAQHVFGMNGVRWLREPDHRRSGLVATQPIGISEHFEFDIRPAPNTAERLDYLYWGTSVDQLWDGMWGTLRVFGHYPPATRISGMLVMPEQRGLAKLFGLRGAPIPAPGAANPIDRTRQVCPADAPKLRFDVSAVRACQLVGGCNDPRRLGSRGITYNRRLNLADPNAIVFVRSNVDDTRHSPESDRQVVDRLTREVTGGTRRLEPLVLRAPAGACIEIKLRNHLPVQMPDGPRPHQALGETGEQTAHFGHNFLSMITDGFNINQFRMSSSIGLSAPMIAQHPLTADGSNVGINSVETARARRYQGSLLPACADGAASCSTTLTWYAGEFDVDPKGVPVHKPIEFGVLPLRSFGDPIKHPMHGAIGALVVGPAGSRPCPSADPRERAADVGTALSATLCNGRDQLLYREHVVILQDAVEMQQDGWPLANLKGAEEPDDYGAKAVNYRTEPLWGRRGGDPSAEFEERNEFDYSAVLSSKGFKDASGQLRCQAGVRPLPDLGCETETPVFVARAGRELRLRVVHPGGHTRQQSISLAGHHFDPYPYNLDSTTLRADSRAALADSWITQGHFNGIGPMMGANLLVEAGGSDQVVGDHLWRSQASFIFDGGQWGLLRVLPKTP